MPRFPFVSARAWMPRLVSLLMLSAVVALAAAAPSNKLTPLRFGILPTGGPSESREDWQPFLDDLSKALGRPVEGVSVSTYEGMYRAVNDHRIDVAFLSGKLALDSVLAGDVDVAAQLARLDGVPGYKAVLLSRRNGPIRTLDQVFSAQGKWSYARGETISVSGYLVPEAQLFALRGISSDLYFKSVHVDNHQNNALAVANGEVDLASNNTADMERFATRFPQQNAQLRVLWTSQLIPHAVLVNARTLPEPTKAAVRKFLLAYARGTDAEGQRQRDHLLRVHKLAGFVPADDESLLPFAEISYALDLQRAQSARWVDAKAKQARIDRLNGDFEQVKAQLEAGAKRAEAREQVK